jgi:hypothetical protein
LNSIEILTRKLSIEAAEAKQKISEIFGLNIRINKNFDEFYDKLKDGMKDDLLLWCYNCKNGNASVSSKKKTGLLVFFRKLCNNIRAIVIKEKNGNFIEFNLFSHKEYDDKRVKLGYKKTSYYLSIF